MEISTESLSFNDAVKSINEIMTKSHIRVVSEIEPSNDKPTAYLEQVDENEKAIGRSYEIPVVIRTWHK